MKTFLKKHREIIVYIIVGLMTTAVAYGVRLLILYPSAAMLSLDLDSKDAAMVAKVSVLRTAAQTLGWIAGVIFAFLPNKKWVFRNNDREKGRVIRQFGAFVASRIGTYFVELGLAVILPITLVACGYKTFRFIVDVDADLVSMAISMVTVTVLNYVLSKLVVFKSSSNKAKDAPPCEDNGENKS